MPQEIHKCSVCEMRFDASNETAEIDVEGREGEAHRACALYAILDAIAEGRGAFSRDPLTHAENTIRRSRELAERGLEVLGYELP